MARRSSPDPEDPYREFWEHPGRSSRRAARRAGSRRAGRGRHSAGRAGGVSPRPEPPPAARPREPWWSERRPPADPPVFARVRADDPPGGPYGGRDARVDADVVAGRSARLRTASFAGGYRPGVRPGFDARTAFARDEPARRNVSAGTRTGRRRAGRGRHGPEGRPAVPVRPPRYPRRSADGLTAASIAVVFAVGLATLAAWESSLLTGEFVGASSAAAAERGKGSAAARPRPDASRSQRPARPAEQDLSDRVNELALRLRGPDARRSYGGESGGKGAPLTGVIRFSPDRTWALGSTVIPVPEDREAMPQAALYVAQRTAGRWQIALSGTAEFDALLARAPAQLMPPGERRALARFSAGAARPTVPTRLMLPWRIGQSWLMTAAPATGRPARPLGLVAFRGGDGRVLAAGPGRFYRLCATRDGGGMVMVIHPDGRATTYYNLTGIPKIPDGGAVARGTPLGRIGTDRPCGGAPVDRPQVQFGLRSGNDDLPLEGVTLGGWTFREQASPLVGWAERGPLQVLPGGLLRNFGPQPPPPAAPKEEPRPDVTPEPDPSDRPGTGRQDESSPDNQESDASGEQQQ